MTVWQFVSTLKHHKLQALQSCLYKSN